MKNNLSGKRRVARTHFKSLLIVSMLTGTASAQMPATSVDSIHLPALPELALPGQPAPTVKQWNAGQHTAWILGLRTRTPLAAQAATETVILPQLPPQLVATDTELCQPPMTVPTLMASQLPVAVSPSPGTVALPGPSNDSMVVPVQFVEEGLPEVPAHVRKVSPVVPELSSPSLDTHNLSRSEPPRIGNGPIMAAPVSPLPLEETKSEESLLNVDLTGIDPASINDAVDIDDAQISSSLIDGLVMPGTQLDWAEPPTDEADLPPIVTPSSLAADAVSNKAKVAIHEGFTPRKSKSVAPPTQSDDDVEPAYSSPQLVKVAQSIDSLADQADTASTTEETRAAQPGQPEPKPTSVKLSMPTALAQLHTEQPSSSESSWSDQSSRTLPEVSAAQLVASDEPESTSPTSETSEPGQPVITQVAKLRLDDAKPTVAELPLPAPVRPAPALLPATKAATIAKAPESSEQMLSPRMIEGEAPASATPIVAAQKVKLPESGLRGITGRGTPAVKPASATLPSDIDLSNVDTDQPSYTRIAAQMAQAVKQKFPESRVRISANEDGLVVDGTVIDTNEATKIMAFIRKTSLCPAADRLNCKR